MFNIFKKHVNSCEIQNNSGMEKFEGLVIDVDDEEFDDLASMPEF